MRGWKVGVLALLVWWVGPASAQVDLEQYVKRAGYEDIKISPDGRHYAATVPTDDRVGLVLLRRSDGKVVASALGVENSVVADFWWANDERVVIAMAEQLGSRDAPYLTGELFSLGTDGARVKSLIGAPPEAGRIQVVGGNPVLAELVDTLVDDPGHVLIAVSDSGPARTQIEKLDIYSGRRTPVASAPVRRAHFVTDTVGELRLAEGARDDNFSKLYYRDDAGAEWRLVNDEAQSGHYERPLGFSSDGVTAYLQVEQESGPDLVVAWNTRTGERTEALRDGAVDPYDIVYDRDGRTLLGVQYMDAGVRTRFVDETAQTARIYRSLEQAFTASAVTITSFTRDGRLALVRVWSDRTPGNFYLYDTQAHTAEPVFALRHWFEPAALSPARGVSLQARDGLTLHGYLTLPRAQQTPARPLPMVVMPHGGPFGVFDEWTFDDDTQLLAEAGYAVLRVNYRGSGNYGSRFRQAGAREWGGRMQDDLTDATRWAIEQKIADPDRICLYGASYGGYAALMGVAREPELYRCAVGYVGVYDLEDLHRDRSWTSRWLRTWAGDWLGQRDSLARRSPTTLADRIKAPVFLAAGGNDVIAPISHSKKMERALRDAGVLVETLYFSSEGHGFHAREHRREFYTRLLDFLARHLGGARAKDPEADVATAR